MKTAWILLGETNTRKSSVARLLTGASKVGQQFELEDTRGIRIHISVMVGAVQERKKLKPDDLVKELNSSKGWAGDFQQVRNALIVLRYDAIEQFPDGKNYVDALLRDGWRVACIASLGEHTRDWVRQSGIPYVDVAESKKMPSNAVASVIRKAFGWI
jgi:hypothetical protein